MTPDTSSFQVGIDFEHVLKAISKQIYETPLAFLRENVQNAVDAIRMQALRDNDDAGSERFRVSVTVSDRLCTIRDNGIGMSDDDLRRLFWTIGASGKRTPEARRAGCVGMFGIGGFANLGVCSKLEVISKVASEATGTLTSISESDLREAGANIPKVHKETSDAAAPQGTIVVGHLRDAPNVSELEKYLVDFVRFAKERVFFNDRLISGGSFLTDSPDPGLQLTTWKHGHLAIQGHIIVEKGLTLRALLYGLTINGNDVPLRAQLRFENGPVDAFKRGFKLCATKIVTQIGVSGQIDCDRLAPTAGRDSLDAESTVLLSSIATAMERVAIDRVLESSDLIAQHTRVFVYILRQNLVSKLGNMLVRLADGSEITMGELARRAQGGVAVYYGAKQQQAIHQVLHARGDLVVILDGERYKQEAQRKYLEAYCRARAFDGIIECAEVYKALNRFESAFLGELEYRINISYDVSKIDLVPGRLTEDVPVFSPDQDAERLRVFVDVRHAEIKKLEALGITPLFYSMVSAFCSEYLGPTLRKRSPKYFGSGAINFEALAKRRSELWVLLSDDVATISKGKQRDVVRSFDVETVRVGEPSQVKPQRIPKILRILDPDDATGTAGAYIRVPGGATKAYGDVIKGHAYRGVVWAGNKIMFVASDGLSSSFQFEVRLDQLIANSAGERQGVEGAADLARPVQDLYGELYFPMPAALESSLIPQGAEEIRIEIRCDWIDLKSAKAWVTDLGETDQ